MKIDNVDRLDSLRYHAVGNAVTVGVAEWIGKQIVGTAKEALNAPRRAALASEIKQTLSRRASAG